MNNTDNKSKAVQMANKFMGLPNPEWTGEEWQAIFENLVDIFKDTLDHAWILESGSYSFATVGEAVSVGCSVDVAKTYLVKQGDRAFIRIII